MAKRKVKKITRVREHLMHVPPSENNPDGITTRRQHQRRIFESLNADEITTITKKYKKSGLVYPASGRLKQRGADKFDELIAIWCDYYNKLFPPTPPDAPLDPNVVKALIASESDFRLDARTKVAIGVAQITKDTLKIVQDPEGELKDHLFQGIRQKDLTDPDIAIPIAVRWLFQKKKLAANKLDRNPTNEEIILEYKGLLKSKSSYQESALNKYRSEYAKLTH